MSYYPKSQKKYRSKKAYSGIARTSQLVRQRRNVIFIVKYLFSHPCVRCGETDILVLEFHHRKPKTKKRGVSDMFHNGDALDTLVKEIKKCNVLCANCHKREHASKIRKQIVKEFLAGKLIEYKRVRRKV
jgi:5-methylcytosine-specific restriction endonuclease McrA